MLVFGHLIFALFVPANSVEVIGEAIRTLEKIDEINIHLNGEIINKELGFSEIL